MSAAPVARPPSWRWAVCGLLLLATMLNYMDRQTLSQMATDVSRELRLSNEDYGKLERGFGLAFATGGIVTGVLVDRVGVRWVYPAILLAWSAVGCATAWVTSASELMFCRVLLGFFEAGQWPCALTTSQRILAREERTLGNSILQSGAALGAITTPLVVQVLVSDRPGSWRSPFWVIGSAGVLWAVAWLALVRSEDLALAKAADSAEAPDPPDTFAAAPAAWRRFVRRFLALAVVVVCINVCWHFFRAWLPKMLREQHGYGRTAVNAFTSAYYVATDAGCLTVGFAVRKLSAGGWSIHAARMALFLACALLTSLSLWVANLGSGPLLLVLLLVIGFGALGLFPNYYSFTQELAPRHQGKVTGSLSLIAWISTACMQWGVGWWIDRTGSYARAVALLGIAPLAGYLVMTLLWDGAGSGEKGENDR